MRKHAALRAPLLRRDMPFREDVSRFLGQLVLMVILVTLVLEGPRSATAASAKCSLVFRNSSDVVEDATAASTLCCKACPTNSTCTGEDTCTCKHGFSVRTRKASSSCQPVCNPACDRSEQCVEPGRCGCKDGYARTGDKEPCLPVCPGGCGVGEFCFRPRLCDCKRGYTRVEGECVPQCKSCINGHCVEPDRCECLPGFVQTDPAGSGTCVPACGGGTCSGHGRCNETRDACQCDEGYAWPAAAVHPHACEPHCTGGCGGGGRCEAPSTCVCSEGYALPGAGTLGPCVAVCPGGCPNGHCAAPNRCECNPGFERSDDNAGTCRPLCSPPCVNATCAGVNACRCLPGHRPHPRDAFVCEPEQPTPATVLHSPSPTPFRLSSPPSIHPDPTTPPLAEASSITPPSETTTLPPILLTPPLPPENDWLSSEESGNGISSARSGLSKWLRLGNCGSDCAIALSVTALVTAMILGPLVTKLACVIRQRRRLAQQAREEKPLWL